VCVTAGAFLGQCLIEKNGGEWREVDGEWSVVFPGKVGTARPITKAWKHLSNGPQDSILSFYDVMGRVVQSGGIDRL
jgi:hypothetical protein